MFSSTSHMNSSTLDFHTVHSAEEKAPDILYCRTKSPKELDQIYKMVYIMKLQIHSQDSWFNSIQVGGAGSLHH